ncbi:MAG: sorbosone dehydrogenase family protein [Ilumatobacter sp.]
MPAAVDFVPFVMAGVPFVTTVVRPGDDHLYTVDQRGRVLRVDRPTLDDLTSDGDLGTSPLDGEDLGADATVLDVRADTMVTVEEGLVGLTFDPTGSLAYTHRSRASDGHSVISEYEVTEDGNFVAETERVLFVIEQSSVNHNGGQLLFGPDGYLYLGMGDGAAFSDLERTALDLGSPLGKILRIDPGPSNGDAYSVPPDNPFVDVNEADPRVWSYGLRNPFSFSFDDHTGDMWIADVGQDRIEEVNLALASDGVDAGRSANYGWSQFQGTELFNEDQFLAASGPLMTPHQPPRFSYVHPEPECGAVADGLVVRDSAIATLDGWYTYGDWCSGLVWARDTFQLDAEPVVLDTMPGFTQMIQTADGNLYASSQLGTIALVVPA